MGKEVFRKQPGSRYTRLNSKYNQCKFGPFTAPRRKTMRPLKIVKSCALGAFMGMALMTPAANADETCQSPYMAKIVGQEEFVYVWTLGDKGIGDGSDKLVTIVVRPGSKTYGKVLNYVSVGGRHEAHHSGFSDDRRFLWAGGLDTSQIFVFDVASDPSSRNW